MKTIKRSIALVLAMILTLAMSVTVFAAPNADQNTFSLTLNKAVEGHTYEAYQILSGNLLEDKKTLVNIEWGEGINAEGQTALGDAAAYAKTLADLGNNSSELKKQAQIIGANLASASGSVTVTDPDANNVISGLKPGYYLIKDKDNSIQGQDSYTEFILHVTDDVEANVKADVPSVKKKVMDTNDTDNKNDAKIGWQDSADYDIGDDVPFQLTATLPANVQSYKSYYLKFDDTLSQGLDFNEESVTVKLGDKDVKSLFKINYDKASNKLTFTCDNILDNKDKNGNKIEVKNGDTIVIEYKATLNKNAVIGSTGNLNKVKLEFSNNPNKGGEGDRGETPEDKVIVFTYKLIVNKFEMVGEEKKPLTGAEFSLFKKVDGKDELVEVKKIVNAEGTEFRFEGLDDGTYVLRETKAPFGYNIIEKDQTFTISAEHEENNDDLPKLIALTGNPASGSIIKNFGVTLERGELSTDVENKKGAVLPSTGGAGRVAIYVIGAILVLGGGIVLVTKKRVR